MEKDSQNVNQSGSLEACPQCNVRIEAGRPRIVVDSCGHRKCRMCLILDEFGCSLCADAQKAANYSGLVPSVKCISKSLATINALPIVNEDSCVGTCTDGFVLSSVIKLNELDGDNYVAERKLGLGGKIEAQLDGFHNCNVKLNSSHVQDKQVECLQGENVAATKQKESTSEVSSCKSSNQTFQAGVSCNGMLPQKQLRKSCDDQCEDYFAGIETNPEYGATDTLDAVLLTEDSPIINKEPSKNKSSGNARKKQNAALDEVKHIKVLPGSPRKYLCTICRKTVSHRQRKYHSFCGGDRAKPFQCMLCSKSFVSKNHYEYHIRLHAGVRPYSCEVCSKSFYEKVKVVRHMMHHTGERPFECKVCGKKFVEECHLKYHSNIHSKEKVYLCAYCGKQFLLILNLKRHELRHELRQVMCELCGKVFSSNWALIVHKKIHSNVRKHKCPVCSRTFTYLKDMKRHHNIHTSTRNYKCSECEVVFTRKDGLVRHIKGIHQDGGRNKKTDEPEAATTKVADKADDVTDRGTDESRKEAEDGNSRAPAVQHNPKSLEELLGPPSCALESDGESSAEIKLPKCGRIKGSKNQVTAEQKKEAENKKDQKASKCKESHPIFRQIIYSNFQVNGNFKQIPVLLTQDKTVRCKEVSVINRPAGNVGVPTVSKNTVVRTSTSQPCTVQYSNSTIPTMVSNLSPRPLLTANKSTIVTAGGNIQYSPVPVQNLANKQNTTKPATVVHRARKTPSPKVENGVRTITRVPEGLLKPLVPVQEAAIVAAENTRESVVSASNVIQSCGQPNISKVVHDVHWKKRSVEIAMKKQQ